MDASVISGAMSATKFAVDALRAYAATMVRNESAGKIAEALDHLLSLQSTLFDLRAQLAEIQQENFELRAKLRERSEWDEQSSIYGLVETKGGAVVYRTKEPPLRYACPKCFGDRKIQFLQDLKVYSGDYRCPDCKVTYPVDERKQAKLHYPGGSGGPQGWMGN